MLGPPYPGIRQRLEQGKVIPFLGAGASFGSRNPSATPWRTAPTASPITYLPTGAELAECLAYTSTFPADAPYDLSTVAQYYHIVLGRDPLDDQLSEIFSYPQVPGKIHDYLADIALARPLLIMTTNYDDLMERALQNRGAPFDVVIYGNKTTKGNLLWLKWGAAKFQEVLGKDVDTDLQSTSVVYKMHGGINRMGSGVGQYVITEDDYVEFLAKLPGRSVISAIAFPLFASCSFLFLGYSLKDWNFRVLLHRINRINRKQHRHSDIRDWAIEPRSSPLEKKLWESRKDPQVQMFDGLTIDEFLAGLEAS